MEEHYPFTKMTDIAEAFSMFMNPAKMKTIFQQELPGCLAQGWKLTDCRIQYPRYKTDQTSETGNNCYLAAAYHLRGVNKQQNKTEDKILYVRVYPREHSSDEFSKIRALQECPESRLVHIEKYGMITWIFPSDPALKQLPLVMDSDRMRRYFAGFLLTDPHGAAKEIKDIALQVVNYRPEIQCTFRYDLEMPSENIVSLFGKTYCDHRGAAINRRIAILSKRFGQSDGFAVPHAYGYDASLQTLWLEALGGSSLAGQLNRHNGAYLMWRVAVFLADLNGSALEGLAKITQAEQLADIQNKSVILQQAYPALSQRIGAVVDDLVRTFEGLADFPDRVMHGDFRIQQVLALPGGRIAMFDFDNLAMGNPLTDVANFCADLYTHRFGKKQIGSLTGQLLNAYRSASGLDIRREHFDWHYKIRLLIQAYHAYMQKISGLEQIVEQFVAAAETGYTGHAA